MATANKSTARYFEAQINWKDSMFYRDPETVILKMGDIKEYEDQNIFYYLQSESELNTNEGIRDFNILSFIEISNPFLTIREKLIQAFELMLDNEETIRLTANTAEELGLDTETNYRITSIHSNEDIDLYNEESDIFLTVGILGVII